MESLKNIAPAPDKDTHLPRILFSDTASAIRTRSQTVTRRVGMENFKVGDVLEAVSDDWMLHCPVGVQPMARIQIVSTRKEPLRAILDDPTYGAEEMAKEGYPEATSIRARLALFVAGHRELSLGSLINRIEFRYV